ncbi:MAG: maltose alpha-D-glucosyltransferase [Chloroflexi bacterium]|nr:maltose alpha-D-glucosyltransferase [Chloroflexota bacterium]
MNQDPLWYKDAVFYELNVRAFCDSDGDGHGDFRGMIQKLDYLLYLGVNCVWLLPFYPSPLRDDGYDVADYYNISPKFGTLDDFREMLDVYHAAGIKVISDLIVNHTSDQHSWFIESRSSLDNPKRHWYVWSENDQRYLQTRIIFIDTEASNWAYDPHTGQYYWHRFYSEQPDLNFDNSEVQEEILNVMRFWLDMGLDGFRVDAIPYLFEREGTNNENLAETHQFLKRMRRVVDDEYPGRILLAEANQWPRDLLPYLEPDEFQMAFHFPIMPRLFMALRKGNRQDVVDIMNDTPPISPENQWCMFLRNHDELTLEMVTEEQRQWMWKEYAPDDRMRLNLGIRRRLAPLLDNDIRKINLLNALLFSLPGSPIVYYGDEIGMGDNIWLADRNGVRTPMQWDESKNAGFSGADITYEPVINDNGYGYQKVNVAAQIDKPDSLLNMTRNLIKVRSAHPVFGRGGFTMLEPENTAILAYERELSEAAKMVVEGAARVLVVANMSGEEQKVTMGIDAVQGTDLLTGQTHHLNGPLILNPYEYLWLKLG